MRSKPAGAHGVRPLKAARLAAARRAVWLLALLALLQGVAYASPPRYTIAQLYAAAKGTPEMKGAKSFSDNALIVTPAYRVDRGMFDRYYFHPVHGRQIRELLEKDPFVNWWQIDGFVRRNHDRIHHLSLYEEGFILMQLDNPETVLILPVSLVTVKKSEEAVRAYLQLQKP